jgi:hypothetical protein
VKRKAEQAGGKQRSGDHDAYQRLTFDEEDFEHRLQTRYRK